VNRPARRAWRGFVPSLIALLAIGLLALLPDLGPRIVSENRAVQASHGRIQEIVPRKADEPFRPPYATVLILDGDQAGQVVQAYLEGPGGSQIVANYQPGDEVVVTVTKDPTGQSYVAVSDRWRAPLLGGFVLLFAVAVVVVGGLRGFRALLSLGLTIALILKVLIPLVISGFAPIPLAVVTATIVTVVTIGLTEGWTRTSGAAILGTAGALALTGLLAAGATALASFTYATGSDLAFLQTINGRGLDLRGMLLAAFILGAVGVLDDVTVTQAALVESLAARGAHGRDLIGAALDVGRSHIAATVNTLFLAYLGAGLPLLVTIVVSNQPSTLTLNSEEVATEVIRTMVGSLGILAAVPFTTFVAAVVVDRATSGSAARHEDRRAIALAAIAGAITIALAATAILPLGSARNALPNEVFVPSAGPGASSGGSPSSSAFGPSEEPTASDTTPGPKILSTGEPFLLAAGAGSGSVEVTVTSLVPTKVAGQTRVTIGVTYRNIGPGIFAVDPNAWGLLASTGDSAVMGPTSTGGIAAGALDVGATRTGELVGSITTTPQETFVTYTDAAGVLTFALSAGGP
jgi:uncharacterized membrane protein